MTKHTFLSTQLSYFIDGVDFTFYSLPVDRTAYHSSSSVSDKILYFRKYYNYFNF